MSQVTIYLEPEALEAAKAAAARAHVSVSKWFAQFAESEKSRLRTDREQFWAEVDRLRGEDDGSLDFLLDPATRYQGLGEDAPREPID
jgi:hypothetical protein